MLLTASTNYHFVYYTKLIMPAARYICIQQSNFMFIIQNEHKANLAIYFLQTPMQFLSTAKNFVSSSSFQGQKTTSLTDEKSALQQITPVHLIHTKNSIFV